VIKRILLSLLAVIVILAVWQWQWVVYGARMGAGQFKIIWNAKPVEEFLADPNFPDSLKTKLHLIEEVRKFAIDSLGLKDTKNYKTLFDQKGEELMWVVQACEAFELKPKQWDYPIVGPMPYKGFFEKEKAIAEAKSLNTQGYDVSVRNPGGWSTLGWFTDPILSNMLKRSEGDLASLILHEMVHSTIFIKGDADYNENLASFIGDTASYFFLANKYGVESKEYKQYLHEDQDYRKYSKHILRGTKILDSLYQTFSNSEPREEKLKKKEAMIRKIIESGDTLSLFEKRDSKSLTRMPNNTYFMSYHLYQAKQQDFAIELNQKFKGDLKKYIAHLALEHPFL
jgi:predicted aminopeptidase